MARFDVILLDQNGECGYNSSDIILVQSEVTDINKQKFLAELGKLLTFMYEEDRVRALQLYSELFDECEDETGLLQILVSPTRQAVNLARAYDKKERRLETQSQSGGEFEEAPAYIQVIEAVREQASELGGLPPLDDSVWERHTLDERTLEAPMAEDAELFEPEPEPEPAPAQEAPVEPEKPGNVDAVSDAVDAFLADFHIRNDALSGKPLEEGEAAEEPEAEEETPAEKAEAETPETEAPAEAETEAEAPVTGEAAEEAPPEAPELPELPAEAEAPEAPEVPAILPPVESEKTPTAFVMPKVPTDVPVRFKHDTHPARHASHFEEEEIRTERVARVPLLILYAIVAIPVGLLGIALLLALAGVCFSVGAVLLSGTFIGVVTTFGAFAVFADMLLVFGVTLITLAFGLFFVWMAIWLLFGVVPDLVRGLLALARNWCYKEVQV